MSQASKSSILIAACCALAVAAIANAAAPAKDYPITPVPFTAVHVQDSFWSPRMETNRAVTVWYDFKRCEETGRIDNFAKAAGLMKGEFKGIPFDDSDVYKVIEGAAYSLALAPDPKLDKYLDDLIAKIAAAQEPDGYLYTARRLLPPEKMPGMSGKARWVNESASHELYNVGHLYEAAAAHFQATGKRTLLDVATKNADMLCKTFGPGKDQLKEPPGHEEIEIGLCKLYRVTGQQRYLDLARFYVELRGRADTHKLRGPNQQDHKPIYEQDEAVGHAVRAGYYYSGVADVAALTGDKKLIAAIDRLWENVASKKLYLTGGIGATRHGEAFGANYELPNKTAYNETCAAIANALWNERMFLLHGDAKYLDVLERTIYNGFLSGVALTGTEFFYPNPLASDARYKRSPWFGCACCPVNVVRFLPELAGYIYATRGGEAFVNLFAGSTAKLTLGKTAIELRQQTRYPWDGRVTLTVTPEKKTAFTLNVRIPGWARNEPVPSDLYRYDDSSPPLRGGNVDQNPPRSGGLRDIKLAVNGKPVALALKKGFAQIKRTWQAGDTVELELPMPVRRVVAHPAVKEDVDKFAVERGPLVYCAEGADNPELRKLSRDRVRGAGDGGKVLAKVPGADVRFEEQSMKFPGVGDIVTIKIIPVAAVSDRRPGDANAKKTGGETPPLQRTGDALTLIPYCLWENRGPNEMTVWFRTKPAPPEPWSASFCHDNDSIAACGDGQLPKNSNDHSIPRMTWWDHKGTIEWVERTFDKPTKFSASEVYWFDDTGRGACRVPQSWRLLYKDGEQWKPVAATTGFGVKRDQFNRVTFEPVTTTALRLEVQLQPKFSGGILEWRMGEWLCTKLLEKSLKKQGTNVDHFVLTKEQVFQPKPGKHPNRVLRLLFSGEGVDANTVTIWTSAEYENDAFPPTKWITDVADTDQQSENLLLVIQAKTHYVSLKIHKVKLNQRVPASTSEDLLERVSDPLAVLEYRYSSPLVEMMSASIKIEGSHIVVSGMSQRVGGVVAGPLEQFQMSYDCTNHRWNIPSGLLKQIELRPE